MYKIETHLHVSEVSPCGKLPAEEMVRRYAQAGYSTIFITDHYKKQYFEKLGDCSWSEKVDTFFSGYEAAKAAGEKYGITVLPGAEVDFLDHFNHYLVYGFTPEFAKEHPDCLDYGLQTFCELAHAAGMFIVQAHPYRDGKSYPNLDFIDGVEVYNSNPRHEDENDRVAQLVKEHPMPISAGSDAHRPEDVAHSGLISAQPITTVSEFIQLLRSGEVQIIRDMSLEESV